MISAHVLLWQEPDADRVLFATCWSVVTSTCAGAGWFSSCLLPRPVSIRSTRGSRRAVWWRTTPAPSVDLMCGDLGASPVLLSSKRTGAARLHRPVAANSASTSRGNRPQSTS